MAQMQGIVLNVDVLSNIAEFKRYVCTVLTSGTIFIGFCVEYNGGSEGYVYSGPVIHGKAPSEFHLLKLHNKIGAAKALLGHDEWINLLRKHNIKKDEYLVLGRDMNLA